MPPCLIKVPTSIWKCKLSSSVYYNLSINTVNNLQVSEKLYSTLMSLINDSRNVSQQYCPQQQQSLSCMDEHSVGYDNVRGHTPSVH